MSEPLWQELRNDSREGATWVDWHCDPPPDGATYEVTRSEDGGWRGGHPVLAVYEIQVTSALPT